MYFRIIAVIYISYPSLYISFKFVFLNLITYILLFLINFYFTHFYILNLSQHHNYLFHKHFSDCISYRLAFFYVSFQICFCPHRCNMDYCWIFFYLHENKFLMSFKHGLYSQIRIMCVWIVFPWYSVLGMCFNAYCKHKIMSVIV